MPLKFEIGAAGDARSLEEPGAAWKPSGCTVLPELGLDRMLDRDGQVRPAPADRAGERSGCPAGLAATIDAARYESMVDTRRAASNDGRRNAGRHHHRVQRLSG